MLARFAFWACALAAGTAGAAPAPAPRWFALTTEVTRPLVMRGEPSNTGRRVGDIPPGATGLESKGCRNQSDISWEHLSGESKKAIAQERWCRVRYRGVDGWVLGRFLRTDTEPPPEVATAQASGRRGPGRSDAPFTGVEWRAAMIGNIELRESLAWIRFMDNGDLEGHTGCNVVRGSFTSGETAMRIALVMVTRMACLGDTMAAQERLMISALESVEAQQVMGGILRLYGQGGAVHAVFRKAGG